MATELATTTETDLLTRQGLQDRLRAVGEARYHHRHPFHLRMHKGELTRGQLQAWAFNRYYYQKTIPIKDALILARSDSPDFRRAWRKRLVDHDGEPGTPGGIEKWIRLAEATGVPRDLVISERGVLPSVRYAVDAYLTLVTRRSFLEAVASSLTEMFSKNLISLRMDRMLAHYPYLSSSLGYFESRLSQAPEDAAFALNWVKQNAQTRAEQDLAIGALRAKCDILWAQLDALYFAYVEPGWPPPGAFQPESAGQS